MSWGQKGDKIIEKTTGEEFYLFDKHADGWLVSQRSAYYKFSFEELARDFTDPDKKRIRIAKEKKMLTERFKDRKPIKGVNILDLF